MAITTEQIHQTADKLAEQGIKPTQTNVREALGGGSFTTIAEALRTWRQEQETVTQLQAVVIPQDITDRTQVLIAQVWETAQQLANERLSKEREALQHKEALLIGDVEEAQAVVITLENEQAELLAKLDELTAQLATVQSDLEQANAQNHKQAEQLKLLETQLTASTERATDLAERLEQQTQATTKQANTITELKTENATLETKNKNFIERLHHSESEVKKAQEYGERNMKDLADLSGKFCNVQGQNKTLAEQLTKAEALTQQQAEKIEKLTAELATAKATKSEIKSKPTTKAKQEKANNEQSN